MRDAPPISVDAAYLGFWASSESIRSSCFDSTQWGIQREYSA